MIGNPSIEYIKNFSQSVGVKCHSDEYVPYEKLNFECLNCNNKYFYFFGTILRGKHRCENCNINWKLSINDIKIKLLEKNIECLSNLYVHHIDYDKKNLDMNNLISLCNSCHTKTNYNREYWINYFRSRKEVKSK